LQARALLAFDFVSNKGNTGNSTPKPAMFLGFSRRLGITLARQQVGNSAALGASPSR